MKRSILFFLSFIISAPVFADASSQVHQIVYGKKEAPITIIEYTSLTCHHCADFHLYVLPLIKQKYINTGQLHLVVRPLPLDKDALMAFKLVHSLPVDQQEAAMTKMYSAQKHWLGKPPEVAARMLGITPEQCKKALDDKDMENALLASTYNAQKQYKIDATPSFYMGGEKMEGAPTMAEFEKSFEELQNKEQTAKPVVATRLN